MSLTDVSIRNPVFAWMLMAVLVLFGLIAGSRIGVSQYPDVDYPNITVSVSWPGAAPASVEREIVEPLEQALSQVEGVQETTSVSRQGGARITVAFDMNRNIDLALQDVQARVAQAQRQLPRDVPAPTVSKSNPDDTPIITVGVSGPFSRQLLSDVARYQVQERLQTVPGVGQITLDGYTARNVRVWLDTRKMVDRNVAVNDVLGAIGREHVELPGGVLDVGERQVNVHLLGEALDLEAFRNLVVRKEGDTLVKLSDVALVEDGFEDRSSIARLNGVNVQVLGVLKQRGSNSIEVASQVRAQVADLEKSLPPGMKVEVLSDTTRFVEESVHEIYLELGLALALTALVCWLFLGSLSSTLNVILAIPMSLLGTVAVIYFLGFTLNTFTLLGLSLSIGLVVDDAIMVMENIYRHAEMGKERRRAASEGTKEITFAALAATIAIIAIFLPVIFMRGVVGKFFFQFGVTLSIAVAISYFEAVTLAPARCAQILDASREGRTVVGRAVDRSFKLFEGLYRRVLSITLKRPVLALVAAALVVAGTATAAKQLPTEFAPTQDQGRLEVRLRTDSGTTLAAAEPILRQAEQWMLAQPEVDSAILTLNGSNGLISVTLVPRERRSVSAADFGTKLRRELGKIAGLRVSVRDPSQQSFGAQRGSPIDFTVRGSDWDTLIDKSQQIFDDLSASGAVVDLQSDYQVGTPEVQITPDRRRAGELGVSAEELANTVNALVSGATAGKFDVGGRRVDIRTRLLAAQRSRPEDIDRLSVRSATGELVPLSLLITKEERPVLQSITRVDRERAIRIQGNVAPGHSQAEVIDRVKRMGSELPVGYRVVVGGQAAQLDDTTKDLWFALFIGVLVAYMVLASQFNSFIHPVTVLTILPLAVSGAVLGLAAIGATLNVFSMIGLLLLMGIVKKNSIVLVEYANQVREHDPTLDARGAMLVAGPTRFRPILMTTVATMMAAIPAVLALGPGAETRRPMAAAVLGGLALSTLLSLLVVPSFFVVVERLRALVRRKPKPKQEPTAPPPPPSEAPPPAPDAEASAP
ncbi:MAG: efflux RND transporter permease subunit [Polyangiaceae bacterium]